MNATIKTQLLSLGLINGPMTASELRKLAAANGIKISQSWASNMLTGLGKLHKPGAGRAKYNPELHNFVCSSPPMHSADLAQKFGISTVQASRVLFVHKKLLPEKPLTDIAKELPAPISPHEFAKIHDCHLNYAYKVLKAAGKLIKSNGKRRPTRPKPTRGTPQLAPPPARPVVIRKVEARPIAKIFSDWAAKQEVTK